MGRVMANKLLSFKPKQMRRLEAGLRALGFSLHQARALLLLRQELGDRLSPAYIYPSDDPVRSRTNTHYRY